MVEVVTVVVRLEVLINVVVLAMVDVKLCVMVTVSAVIVWDVEVA
jgi:hypothetical protein